jgi:hypothetical protein
MGFYLFGTGCDLQAQAEGNDEESLQQIAGKCLGTLSNLPLDFTGATSYGKCCEGEIKGLRSERGEQSVLQTGRQQL